MKIRRAALVAAGTIVVLIIIGAVILHLPQVKRGVTSRLTTIIAEKTCLVVEAEVFDYRLWPGSFKAHGIMVSDAAGRIVTFNSIEASWAWSELIGQTPRLRRLAIDGLDADALEMPFPCPNDEREQPVDPWSAFAVDDLTVSGTSVSGAVADMAFSATGLQAQARLIDRRFGLRGAVESLQLVRDDRGLRIGPLETEIEGSPDTIDLKTLKIIEGPLRLSGSGSGDGRGTAASAEFSGAVELEEILSWWDPELATSLDASGPLEFAGDVTWNATSNLSGEVRLSNGPIRLAGFTFSRLEAIYRDLQLTFKASDPSWGRAEMAISPQRILTVEAQLQGANPAPALDLASIELPEGLPANVKLYGDLHAVMSLPLHIDQMTGAADLEARWQGGRVSLRGTAGDGLVVEHMAGQFLGAEVGASGSISADGKVSIDGSIVIPDPQEAIAQLSPFFPKLDLPTVTGGQLAADLRLTGSITEPRIESSIRWNTPEIEGNHLESANARIAGTLDHIDWSVSAVADGGLIDATGTASPRSQTVAGSWLLEADDLSALQRNSSAAGGPALAGSVTGNGTLHLEPSGWSASALLNGRDIGTETLTSPQLTLEAKADNDCASIESFEAEVLGGRIRGSGGLCPIVPAGELSAFLQWTDIDPSDVFDGLPESARGLASGRLDLAGPIYDPEGEALVYWESTTVDAPLESGTIGAQLQDGMVTVVSDHLQTIFGPLALRADLPLGDLPRPADLWSSAPGGDWHLSVSGRDLNLAPAFEVLNRAEVIPSGSSGLNLTASWPPGQRSLPQVHLEFIDFEATIGGRRITSERPIRLAMDNRGVVVTDIDLQGNLTRVAAGGSLNLITSEIDLSFNGSLDPRLAALAPIPMTIVEPVTFEARIQGPADAWQGHLDVKHGGGSIEISEPPMEISNASLEIQWVNGLLEIDGGSAQVNRGSIDLGGAWDPKSGQGIVAELEDVTVLLPGGIISRWDGLMALEPASDRVAVLVGGLNLKHGVWDYPFNLGAALRGGLEETELEADHISHRIGLDVEVRGGSGIAVDNNLGKFGVRWGVLEVGGTAAQPLIIGDLNFLPGGILNAAGHPIAIRRGLIQFTGDPLTDPVIEVIPEDQIYASSGETGDLGSASQQQVSNLAAAGLASGIGAVFGLENTSIKPEEIALETDDDTSTNFSIGQQLNHNTAIFLTTDLHNSQKRTTLLQLWRLPSIPGLTIQAQTRTDPGEADVKLLQRFSWGGTLATDDQPRLRKVQLEGDWPWSKRKLRKATGLVRDQPWDPFFLFLGDIRLRKKLAEKGWPEARVSGRLEGSNENPIAVFTCTPGRYVEFSFEGDEIDKSLKSSLRPLYRFPPLEKSTVAEIERITNRNLWAEGHPDAKTTIDSDGNGKVIVTIDKGPYTILTGPVLEGAPAESIQNIKNLLGNSAELAQISRNPELGDRVVRRALATKGYRDVRSVDIWTSTETAGVTEIHIKVDPGPRAQAIRFELVGNDPLGLTDTEDFPIHEGMTLDREVVDRAVASLRRTYRKNGYTNATVRSQIYEDGDKWAILLILDPGSTSVIDRVAVTGRRHLSKSILLDGMNVEPGELFLLDDLDDSVSRLATFEPIERVTASTHPEGGKVVVDLDIVEKPRWTAEVGGGWNSDRGITARVGAVDHNLLGRGLSLGLRGRWEDEFLQGRLILGLPPKPGGRFSAGLNASYTEDVLQAESEGDLVINEHIREATLEGLYRLRPGLWTRAYYRFTRTRSFEKDPIDFFPFDITIDIAVLGGQIVTDRLDNPFDPRHGYYLGFDLSWAGKALGSDKENIRGLLTSSLATEPRSGWTWFQSLRVGAAKPFNGVLDRQSRFFAGGAASIRGFKLDSVGPVETIGDTTFYAGGEALFVLNEELRFPLWQSLRGAAFIDTGQVWDTWSDADFDLSVGAGVGLRWGTPIGPLWVDVAWPVANPGLNSGARFSFGIGRTF